MPIGVFDSGLGGLTVLAALRAGLPNQDYVYLGDNAHAPYGTRPAEEIHALTRAGVARLLEEGCGLVILACNTRPRRWRCARCRRTGCRAGRATRGCSASSCR